MMLTAVKSGLWKGTILDPDPGTYEELASFLSLPNGGYGAAPGCHDDRVMALALAQVARTRKFARSW